MRHHLTAVSPPLLKFALSTLTHIGWTNFGVQRNQQTAFVSTTDARSRFAAEVKMTAASNSGFELASGDATAITKNKQFKPAVCVTSAG